MGWHSALEVVCFTSTSLQGVAALLYIGKEYWQWHDARKDGAMNTFVIHRPFLLLALICGAFVTSGIGFWIIFHPPTEKVADMHHPISVTLIPAAPNKKLEVVNPPTVEQKHKKVEDQKRLANGDKTLVEVGAGGNFSQSTTGDCSPAIVGSGNTSNCGVQPKPDRHIPEARKQELIDLLKERPSKIQICALVNNRESFVFAQDWYRVFDQAGWEIQERRIVPFLSSIPWAGVQVGYSDTRPASISSPLQIPSDEYSVILVATVLNRLGIKDVTGDPDPAQSRDLVILRIGDNP